MVAEAINLSGSQINRRRRKIAKCNAEQARERLIAKQSDPAGHDYGTTLMDVVG